jgi:hypothetical protein
VVVHDPPRLGVTVEAFQQVALSMSRVRVAAQTVGVTEVTQGFIFGLPILQVAPDIETKSGGGVDVDQDMLNEEPELERESGYEPQNVEGEGEGVEEVVAWPGEQET